MLKRSADWGKRGSDWQGGRLTCPACGRDNNRIGSPEESREPDPGDLAVCIGCACILIVQPDFSLRIASLADLAALDPEEKAAIDRMERVIRMMHADMGKPGPVPPAVAWPPRK